MKCRSCGKEIAADDWVVASETKYPPEFVKLSLLAVGKRIFCSEDCMKKKRTAEHRARQDRRRGG